MIPLFSATNTRPFGANSIAVGVSRPEKATDSWNPAGSVVAPAGAARDSPRAQTISAHEKDARKDVLGPSSRTARGDKSPPGRTSCLGGAGVSESSAEQRSTK